MDNTVFSVLEVAEYLRTSESTIRRHVKKKKIPYYRVGTTILFRKTAIDEWIIRQECQNESRDVI